MLNSLPDLAEDIQNIFRIPFLSLHPHFIFLFKMMTIFILIVIFIPFITTLTNLFRNWNNSKRKLIEQKYKKAVFDYLIGGETVNPVFEDIRKKSHKDILVNIIFGLVDYVDGEDKYRLRNLFLRENLDDFCIGRIKAFWGYKKGYYLERLSIASSNKVTDDLLKKNMQSRLAERRMYAMQALMLRNLDRIEQIFEAYTYKLSLWEQMNHYNFFIYREIEVPDFHRLALVENTSVVLFAIRMVRMYKQRIGSIEGYESLLKHPSLEVQFEMFLTLAEFGYANLNSLLDDIMPKVSLPIRMHIMTYLSKKESTDTHLLMQYYYEDDSVEFRLHILYCIYNFVWNGKQDIEQFTAQDEDKMLHDLSVHLITNIV